MATALSKFASFFRPIGKGSEEAVSIKPHPKEAILAEVRFNANVINIDNLASAERLFHALSLLRYSYLNSYC